MGAKAIRQFYRQLKGFCSVSLMLAFSCCAMATAKPSERMTLSYGDHPQMPVFIELFREAYATLGYQTEFISMPQRRGLMALASGEVDADVMRLRHVAESVQQSVIVPNFSIKTSAVLLCKKTVPCNQGELFNRGNKVVTVRMFEQLMRQHYGQRFEATLHSYDTLTTPLALLEKGRIDYALYVFVTTQFPSDVEQFATVVNLFEIEAVHLVNEKHRDLIGELDKVLLQLVPKYFPKRQQISNTE